MITITTCPICSGNQFKQILTCQDYTVSRETFSLIQCLNCSFLATSPRPEDRAIGKYYLSEDYISHTNKATSIIDRIYLLARRYTLNWKLKLINYEHHSTERKILDFGCGTGAFLNHCKQNNWNITGVEPSSEARAIAREITDANIHSSVEETKIKDFDVITLWHVLEHIPDLDNTISILKKHLSNNGTMFIAVPNYKCRDARVYQQQWAGYDVPRHLWHFSQTTMNLLMQKHQLKVVNTIPMKLDSYYVSLLSEKYKSNKTTIPGMIKAFLNGLISNLKAGKNNEYSSLIYEIKK